MKPGKGTLIAACLVVIGLSCIYEESDASAESVLFDYRASNVQRDNVHHHLLAAQQAYNIWDMRTVENELKAAYQFAPHRLDILFSIAASQIWQSNTDAAMNTYERILKLSPDDVDALTYKILYSRAMGREDNLALQKLQRISPGRSDDIKKISMTVERTLHTFVMDRLPEPYQPAHPPVIVTLGYALESNGAMAPTLIQRLSKTLEISKKLPNAKIILTGGVPKNGKNEGIEMKKWLTENGIKPDRIIDENYARDTVENMIYSRYIINELGVKDVVLVSSGTHVRRGKAVLEIQEWGNGKQFHVQMVAAPDRPLTDLQNEGERVLGIYRDALRAYGMQMMRSAPELYAL